MCKNIPNSFCSSTHICQTSARSQVKHQIQELLDPVMHQTLVFVILCLNSELEPLFVFVELIPSALTQLNRAEFSPIITLLFSVHAQRISTPITPQTTEPCRRKSRSDEDELQTAASSDRLELPYGSSGGERVCWKSKLTEQRELVRDLACEATFPP